MIKIKNKINIEFIINPHLNYFFHLEAISGSINQRYSEKYHKEFQTAINNKSIQEFKWNFDSQVISWFFKIELMKIKSPKDLELAFQVAGKKFSEKIKNIFLDQLEDYMKQWKNIEVQLKEYKNKLLSYSPEIKEIISRINNITDIPWKNSNFKIYLIYSLSEKYKVGGEPIGNGIAIGIIKDFNLLKKVVAHEFIHLNVKRGFIDSIPLSYKKDYDKINEALTDVLVNLTLGINKKPISKGKMNKYINLFWRFANKKRTRNLEEFFTVFK